MDILSGRKGKIKYIDNISPYGLALLYHSGLKGKIKYIDNISP